MTEKQRNHNMGILITIILIKKIFDCGKKANLKSYNLITGNFNSKKITLKFWYHGETTINVKLLLGNYNFLNLFLNYRPKMQYIVKL